MWYWIIIEVDLEMERYVIIFTPIYNSAAMSAASRTLSHGIPGLDPSYLGVLMLQYTQSLVAVGLV